MKPSKILLVLAILISTFLIAKFYLRSKASSTDPDTTQSSSLQTDSFQKNDVISKTEKSDPQNLSKESSAVENETLSSVIGNLNSEDRNKWNAFENILKTKNDNDPHVDKELKSTSPTLHEALFLKYNSMPSEDRSGKGLIVYLIARDIKSEEDVQFLKKIYQEKPCLSLSDCSSLAQDEDSHHASTTQTTLLYPQFTALYVIAKELKDKPELLNDVKYRNGVIQIITLAENFPVSSIQNKAREIKQKYNL